MSGFITMQREVLDHPLFRKDASRLGAWLWLLARAAWKPTPFDVAGKTITLERGQLCVSRAQLAEAWGWSPSAVERFLTRLKTEQMIGQETGQGKSILTIQNYSKYQDLGQQAGQATGQATGQRSDSDRTTKEPENHITSLEEPIGSSPRQRKRAHQLPADFQPILTPAARLIAEELGGRACTAELQKFRDHYTANGKPMKDWQAAFRKWLTNANEYRRQTNGRTNGSAPASRGNGELAELERRAIARRSGGNADPFERQATRQSGTGGSVVIADPPARFSGFD